MTERAEPSTGHRRRIRRGEGEVTEWPRGLVDYTPTGPVGAPPSQDEDRDRNRLRLAARLLGLARAQGRPVDDLVSRLHEADRALRAGDRQTGRRMVDDVIAQLERIDRAGERSGKLIP